ncbi:MAG: efflux RND transporter permease subunit [Bdellovibrionaceae bacterium]|nr:efflux RND transporter permease subunit [Pseudobdellovibrionaceae bacterium]
MRTSDVSIRNSVFAWMLMAGLMVFGAVGFSRMGVSQLPDVDFPVVTVTITLQGAAPEVMESTISDPLEDQLMSIEGLRTLTTVSSVGTLTATLEFELSRNVDAAVQDTQTKVTAAQKLFPQNVDPPTITKTNPDDQPIVWLALTSDKGDLRGLMSFARDFVKDRFTSISGVGNVLLGGYVEPAMRVWLKPPEMLRRNIAVTDVIDALNLENIEMPGGNFSEDGRNFNLRTLGEAKNAQDFGNIVVIRRAGQLNQDPTNVVRLRDVARIEPGLQELTRLSRFNGVPAVGLGIVKQKGSNAVAVARAVKGRVEEVSKSLPPGYAIAINFDTTRFIEDSVHELTTNLFLSAALTAVACWIFLGSLSATFNVILAIPTSIMGAFIVLYFMGFTLNTFTLLGLSLAIGIVVDDSIMVLENIFRHNEEGQPRLKAAIVGAREITFAAVAATVAIVAIFLPVAFMTGVIGQFFFQFGVTISVTVLLSLLEALTITPMRLSRFGSVKKRTDFIGRRFEAFMDWLRAVYTRSLAATLNHPWKVVMVATLVMVLSFGSVFFLRKEFSPPQDQSIFLVRVKTDVEASIDRTDALMKKAEEWMKGRPEIRQTYVAVGGFTGASYNTAIIFVTMHEPDKRPVDPRTGRRLSQQEFMAVLREGLSAIDPSLQVVLQDLSMRGFTASRGFPIEFTLRGDDWDKLWKIASGMMEEMKQKGLATDIDTDYLLGKPEVEILPDRLQAGLRGVSVKDIGDTIGAMIGGMRVNQYTESGHRYYVMLQVEPAYQNLKTLRDLKVNNQRNNLVPMRDVTVESIQPAMQSITRIDRQRAISVFANPAPGHSQQEAINFIESKEKDLPPGYRLVLSGSAQTFKESFESLIFALVLGIFVAFMVLGTQFNSFIDPISVLIALPFSVSGAFLALLITNQSLNIYSMIGLILLMGIVKKNSILLVDFTNAVRDRGEKDVKKALLEACPVRLRPILMTSFACITAAIPPALSLGAGSETGVPMAVSIIGGVTVSTFLTIYVVPSVYELFSRIQKRQQNREEIRRAFTEVGNEGLA